MSGTPDPGVFLPGDNIDELVAAIGLLGDHQPVIVGGLAVMSRLGTDHRVTSDLDATFDRPDDPPTTTLLVADGVAEAGDRQRVRIDGVDVDVIDTFEIVPDDLPDEPKLRLFACSHRFAWETGTPVAFHSPHRETTVKVATVDALVAMKAHALRYGTSDRRRRKRSSDLLDLLLLASKNRNPVLSGAPWGLAGQVREALSADLAQADEVAATVRQSTSPRAAMFTADLVEAVVTELLDRLTHPSTVAGSVGPVSPDGVVTPTRRSPAS